MQKSPKSAVFYKIAGVETEIRSGYLFKSPPSKRMKSEKSWKKRFFVLFKINDHQHELKYFRNAEERDKAMGGIDLAHISVMYPSPQHHPRWSLIQKSFKCSPSCVLYIGTAERDYFLVGDSSEEMDAWFTDLFDAQKNRPHSLHDAEDLSNGQQTIEVISKPATKMRSAAPPKPMRKIRSISDPCENAMESNNKLTSENYYRRRASEPVNPIYDYPRSFLTKSLLIQESASFDGTTESIYETMTEIKNHEKANAANEEFRVCGGTGTLMRTVTEVFEKMKIQVSQMPTCNEESDTESREEAHASDSSSTYSENSALSNDNLSSVDSLDQFSPEERDVRVKLADVKKFLLLTDADGKLSVTGWIGTPATARHFQKGDQILGVNDLRVGSVEEFNTYITKSLKAEVKVTLRRLPETPSSPTSVCSD